MGRRFNADQAVTQFGSEGDYKRGNYKRGRGGGGGDALINGISRYSNTNSMGGTTFFKSKNSQSASHEVLS